MKFITEENAILARNALLKKGNNLGACAIDMLISDHLKEIDTLTVSKLRLMVDLLQRKDYKTEVLATRNSETFMRIRQSSDDEVYCFELGKYLHALHFIGWIPMPIYKPELTGDEK